MSTLAHDVKWYALSCRARQERAASADLAKRGFEILLPMRPERRMWSDRVQTVEKAIFPGYLFVHTLLTAQNRVDMLKVPQVHDLVGRQPGDERIALPIPDVEIESIRTMLEAGRDVQPHARMPQGTRVVVVRGALKGCQGVVEETRMGKQRLIVLIELLGRGVRTMLTADDVLEATAG